MTWTPAGAGYEVALRDGKVICRNSAGKQLRSVPAALKADPVVLGLRQLVEWLAGHDAACVAEVETWMVRSLPLPLAMLVPLWPDPSWRAALRDLVVRADDEVGLLRDLDPARGAGLVTLDGDTVWLQAETLSVPHPVLLPDLDELRDFAADLAVEQSVAQLFRETASPPDDLDPAATARRDWAGGRFQQLRHATGRAASLGYVVRGGYATVRVFEGARQVEARLWIGSGPPDEETETGELGWVDGASQALPLGEVGPVAWSEGARMATRVHAGRAVADEDAA